MPSHEDLTNVQFLPPNDLSRKLDLKLPSPLIQDP